MTNFNFYYSIKQMFDEGYVTEDEVAKAFNKHFITLEQYRDIIPDEDSVLKGVKSARISESRTLLEDYLAEHPYVKNGKQYTVTSQKQALLANAIATYQISAATGTPKIIKWNTTGEECTEFTYEEICALALEIAAYVEPKVSHQQAIEVQIRNCQTVDEIIAIEINYD